MDTGVLGGETNGVVAGEGKPTKEASDETSTSHAGEAEVARFKVFDLCERRYHILRRVFLSMNRKKKKLIHNVSCYTMLNI